LGITREELDLLILPVLIVLSLVWMYFDKKRRARTLAELRKLEQELGIHRNRQG
jgi:hypothetical protein